MIILVCEWDTMLTLQKDTLDNLRTPYTVKKGYRYSPPHPGYDLLNSPWPGIIKSFPARESLENDTPAG
jgi:hypothetical protein